MAFIDKIVKFHTFSKSTVRDNLTLGEAVNPSGHTVTSSQVRTDDIPAFIDTFQDTKTAALTWAATNVDANARHNDILYYGGKFNMGFSNPKCLIRVAKQVVDGKLVDLPADQHTWADFTITDKSFLANADGKNVIAIHKDADICYVHGDNNAAVNSNQNSAFVRKSDGTFLDHFVAPTDQILGGQPSLGYGLCLFKSGTTKALTEGEETGKNNYIGNTFAGLIHFMDTRSEAADAADNYKAAGFYVNCFEYIGGKLDTTLGNIREEIQDIVGVTMEGVVASVGTNDAATSAGIGVDSSVKTSPKITFTAGSVATGETKLVSGGAVAAVTDALAGRIAALEGVKLSVKVVDTLPTTPVVNTLYLVPEEDKTSGNYVEYIAYKPEGSETVTTERIGTTAVDLEGYTTDAEHTALADRVTALDAATTGRVAVVEGKVKTLEETTVPAAITTAQGYTDTKIADELKDTGSIGAAINAAKEAAIANAKVTLTAGSGITIPNSGEQDTAFTISVDTSVIATKTSVDDLSDVVSGISQVVASNKTEIDGKISVIEGQLGATGATGQAIQAAQDTADEAKGIAETAVQSVIKASGSSDLLTVTDGTDVTISLSTEVATKTDAANAASTAIATSLNSTDANTIGAAVADAKKAGTDAASALNTAKEQTLAQTGTLSGMFSVTTAGTVGTGITGITITDTGLADAITKAKTDALGANITTATGKDAETAPKVTVQLSGTVQTPQLTVTTADIASAQELADLKQTVTNKNVTTSANAQAVGVTASNNTVDVDVATYTNKAWAKKTNLVTGSVVESAISDAKSDVLGTTITTATGKDDVTAPKVTVELSGSVQTPSLTVTTNDIASAKALSDLETKVDNFHKAGVSYQVLQSLPTASATYNGVVVLVPASTEDDPAAVAGDYVEHLCVNKGTEDAPVWDWERIGTTKADLTQYAKTADLNVTATTVNGLTYSQTDGVVSVSVDAGSTSKVGTVQLTDTYTGTEDTKAATGKSIAAAIETLNSSKSVNGITVTQTNGVIESIAEELITASVPANTTSVEGNVAYVGSTKHVIAPEKFQTAATMPSTLTSWVADLSNLTNGDNMFKGCTGLTVFVGDLSSLTSAVDMFNGCTLDKDSLEILAENLPTVTGGTIDIGASTNATDEVIATIKGKGWTLKSNGADVA